MPTPKKVQEVEELTELLRGSPLTILTDYRGLSVSDLQRLRTDLRENGSSFRVVKNTLTGIAATNAGLDEVRPYLEGPTAIVTTADDPVGPAKATQNFARSSRVLTVKVGIYEGSIIPAEEIERLATLPTREELLGQVVSGLNAPIQGLVGVLSGPVRSLAYVLQARAEQLGNEGASS